MEAVYYMPKRPDSVPFIDVEANKVELMIDGEWVEISYTLFKKLFKEADPHQNESFEPRFFTIDQSSPDSVINSLRGMAEFLKKDGVDKEMFIRMTEEILEIRGMGAAKDRAKELIEEIFKDT